MQVGTLVSHEGLLQQIGIVVLLMENDALVYFPQLDERYIVFIDDMEVLC